MRIGMIFKQPEDRIRSSRLSPATARSFRDRFRKPKVIAIATETSEKLYKLSRCPAGQECPCFRNPCIQKIGYRRRRDGNLVLERLDRYAARPHRIMAAEPSHYRKFCLASNFPISLAWVLTRTDL